MDASIGDEKHDDIEQYTCKIAGETSIKGSSIPRETHLGLKLKSSPTYVCIYFRYLYIYMCKYTCWSWHIWNGANILHPGKTLYLSRHSQDRNMVNNASK